MEERQIPQPPAELFERTHRQATTGETIPLYQLDGDRKPSCIECSVDRGMFVYRVNAEYPEKGFPFPEQIYALNQIKRVIVSFTKLCSHPLIALGVLFYDKNKLMEQFNDIFDKIFETYAYKEAFFCDASRYFNRFLYYFLIDCGFNHDISKGFAFRVAQIVEGDNMYRYRIQDIAGELQENTSPYNEVSRLFKIYATREESHTLVSKMGKMVNMLKFVLLIPKYKKAFMANSHLISKMALDDGDFYWATLAGGWHKKPNGAYHFKGTTWEQRHALIKKYPIRDYGTI